MSIERLRMTFTANGKQDIYDHETMFILYLPLAVFSFAVKSSSFAFNSKARISLHYSHLSRKRRRAFAVRDS